MWRSCGSLEPIARERAQGQGMDIDDAFALLADLELREVEDLDQDWFEAELQAVLPLA